jgi:hypothetical protein
MSSRNASTGRPSSYGREKLAMLRGRSPLLKPIVDRMIPHAFRGVDPAFASFMLQGFTSFSTGWNENTTEAVADQTFHEVGLFQVPAGLRNGPAPNPDPRASHNAYGRLAGSAIVRAMLGNRAASTAPDAWKPRSSSMDADNVRARDDQTAVGIANLLEDEASFRAQAERFAPGSAGAVSGWSLYRFMTMFTAMSRGPAGAFNRFKPYLRQLAQINESQRSAALVRLVHQGIIARDPHALNDYKDGVCYAICRSWQKILSGRELCIALGGPTDAFADAVIAPDVEAVIADVAYTIGPAAATRAAIQSATGLVQNAAGAVSAAVGAGNPDTGKKIIAAVGVIAVGGAVVLASSST